jgi:hypothetical protein
MPKLRTHFALAAGLALAVLALVPSPRAHGEAYIAAVQTAKGHVDVEAKAKAKVTEYAAWHDRIAKIHSPRAGCFTAKYPSTTWKPVPCGEPLKQHFDGRVGNGNDISSQSGSKLIGTTTGRFDNITGLVSETSPEGNLIQSNSYEFQINPNHFNARGSNITLADGSNPCARPEANCDGWQQFIFTNDGAGNYGVVFIEYWLNGFHKRYGACPSGPPTPALSWVQSEDDCYANSHGAYIWQSLDVSQLGQVQFTATAVPGLLDEVTLTVGPNSYRDSVVNVLGLSQGWMASEFNIFGYGEGLPGVASFNPGTSLTVVDTLEGQDGKPLALSCISGGFTAEGNNLNLACPCFANVNTGEIFFTESNAANPVCACPYGETWDAATSSCHCPPGESVINGSCGCPPGSTYDPNLMRCGPPTCNGETKPTGRCSSGWRCCEDGWNCGVCQ